LMKTRITALLGIQFPVIQAGMVWVSGYKLAVAVSNAGALGLIGSGSMKPELLREHIRAARERTSHPFGVNIPLLRGDADKLVGVVIDEGVKIVVTSAGHPAKFTGQLKNVGCSVVHVIASVKQALKAQSEGCDAVVAEGFEAGGHNGIDEITTLALVPQVVDAVHIPVIAAGGIADGRGMAAALALGAEGVQVGTRFAASLESSAHQKYKEAIIAAGDSGTVLTLKNISPVRLLHTPFTQKVIEAEHSGASYDELRALLGAGRERKGIFEGDWEEGEFEAGQSSGLIREILPAAEIVRRIMEEYQTAVARMSSL
jgi:enoyl-[acyl-carrier protein] reductase II